MQVLRILYIFLVICGINMSFSMSQKLPGPRNSRVGVTRPSLIPIFRRKLKKKRCSKRICPKKLRPAYAAPSFYASPKFLGYEDVHLVALIPENNDLIKKVSHSKSNENVPQPVEDFLSHKIMKVMKQHQEKSDNKLTMKQTEVRTLPLAYEVYKPINAFNYPPYF